MKKYIYIIFSLLLLLLPLSCIENENKDEIKDLMINVTFNPNNGNDVKVVTLEKGERVEAMEVQFVDHIFEGWYIDEALEIPFDFSLKINASINLYAKYTYVPPVIEEPKNIIINNGGNLITIDEIKNLLAQKVNYEKTFNFYQVEGEITNIDENQYELKLTDKNQTIIKVYNLEKKEKGYKIGDKLTLLANFTYLDGLMMDNPTIINIIYCDRFVEVVVNETKEEYNLDNFDQVSKIPLPKVEDYEFEGWFYDENYTNKVNEEDKFVDDVVIYAKMNVIPHFYVTTLICNSEKTYKFYENVAINSFEIQIFEELEFKGWYFDENYENTVPTDYVLSENISLYAKYDPIVYFYITIHYDEVKILKLKDALDVLTLETPSKEDHIFKNWCFDEELTNDVSTLTQIDYTCDLYPKFEKIPYYYINLHFLGETNKLKSLGDVSINALTYPEIANYVFDGWYFDSSFTNKIPENYLFNTDIDVYAKYREIKKIIVTIYYLNEEKQIEYTENVYFNDVVKTYQTSVEGYEFLGWYFDETFTKEIKTNIEITESIRIYASFHKIIYYKVTIIVDSQKTEYQVLELTSLSDQKIKNPTKDGYLFTGYYLDEKLTQNFDVSQKINQDLVLYAGFKEEKITYDLKLIIDGKEEIRNVVKGTKISELSYSPKEDYNFEGWYKDSNYSQKVEQNTEITSNMTLYGKYTLIPRYTVYLHILNDVKEIKNILINTSLQNIIYTPDITDYIFEGWFYDEDCNKVISSQDQVIDNLHLYAKFKKVNYYIIRTSILGEITTYDHIKENTILSNIIKNPVLNDYYFKGWYLDESFESACDLSLGINSDVTLYAKCEAIVYYNVITNILGTVKTYEKIVEGTSLAKIITNPSITDYIFDGWFTDENYQNPITLQTNVYTHLTLYAKMTKINYYDVTSILKTIDVVYQTDVKTHIKEETKLSQILKTLTFDDYYFEGWFYDDSFTSPVDLESKLNANLTVYGKLVKIPYYEIKVYVDENLVNTYSVKENASLSTILLPSKNEDYYGTYKFSGWYEDASFLKNLAMSYKFTSSLSLYAKFTCTSYHYIKIYGTDLTYKLQEPNHLLNKIPLLNSKDDELYHYTFKGYSLEEDGTILSSNYQFTLLDTVLYPCYDLTPYRLIDVYYLDNHETYKVLNDTELKNIKVLSIEGYKFSGWYQDPTFTTELSLATKMTSNLTLYAKYLAYLTISQVVNLKSSVSTLLEGDSIQTLTIPSVLDYDFKGWYFDDTFITKIPDDYKFTTSMTIYAKMVKVPYYKIFVYSDTTTKYGMTKYTELSIKNNTLVKEVLSKISNPEVTGYTFSGWYYDEGFMTPITQTDVITADLSLYAYFKPNTNTLYTVKYWYKGEEAYKLHTTKEYYGVTNSTVQLEYLDAFNSLENKDYYHLKEEVSGVIRADGKAIFDVYFDRNSYTIKYFVQDQVVFESEPYVWGSKITFLTNTAFKEEVGDAFISGWFKNAALTEQIDYETMLPGGISIYGDVELIYPGTSGIIYQLNENEDGYNVVSYEGEEKEVVIANGYLGLPVTKILKGAFYEKGNITTITMSNHITEIEDFAFYKCTSLSNLVLSKNIKTIGNRVFGYTQVQTLNLGQKLEKLGEDCFIGCPNLEIITLENSVNYYVEDGILYNYEMSILLYYPSMKNNETFIVNEKVKEIASHAFSLTFNLKNIDLNKTQKLNPNCFYECQNLETIKINAETTYLAMGFLQNVSTLKVVEVSESNIYYSSINGVLFNKDQTILYLYPSGKTDVEYLIPSTVKEIASFAFIFNKCLTSITLTENIKKCNYLSFYCCDKLVINCEFTTIPHRFNENWYKDVKDIIFEK